jgi:hypothetical protein
MIKTCGKGLFGLLVLLTWCVGLGVFLFGTFRISIFFRAVVAEYLELHTQQLISFPYITGVKRW